MSLVSRPFVTGQTRSIAQNRLCAVIRRWHYLWPGICIAAAAAAAEGIWAAEGLHDASAGMEGERDARGEAGGGGGVSISWYTCSVCGIDMV